VVQQVWRKADVHHNLIAGKLGLQLDYLSSFRKINLNLGEVKIGGVKTDNKEAYSLQVDAGTNSIIITGNSAMGVFYGVQSLLSLSEPDGLVPQVTINDAPRYEYRGMELDVGRNFMPKSEILKMIEAMAMYKLNKFHFHLTDDEGWRLEIPGLPELTEVCLTYPDVQRGSNDIRKQPNESTRADWFKIVFL